MPDDELLDLAAAGRLCAPAVLDAQVKRMLADERSSAFADNFAGQWLEIRNLNSLKPAPQKFPEWSPEMRDAMRTETRLFFVSLLRENRPLSEFLDARYTVLNGRLAQHYGVEGVTGPDFRRVDLSTDQRGGILSQASVRTVSSYPTRTSPVIRGKYVLQNILGTPPPPPPPMSQHWTRPRLATRDPCGSNSKNTARKQPAPPATAAWMYWASAWRTTTPSASGAPQMVSFWYPVVDAYRAWQPMPYDAPTTDLAAVLYAVRPHENYFRLSEPGTIQVRDDGRTVLMPSAEGRHRYLVLDPRQKERVLQAYTDLASAKPAPRQRPPQPKQDPPPAKPQPAQQ